MTSGHALDLHQLKWYDDEALRRARRAPGRDRELLRHLLLPGERKELLAPEVIRSAIRTRIGWGEGAELTNRVTPHGDNGERRRTIW